MARLDIFEYKEFKGLWLHERTAITDFFNSEPEALANLLTDGGEVDLSPGMRDFLADVIRGKEKVTRRGNMFNRNFDIYQEVSSLIMEGFSLTCSRNADGAGLIVANKMNLSEDTVVKAYNKIKRIIKDMPVD